jgi:very-short-patch-repair endonuclease
LPESAQEIRVRFELMHIFTRMHNSNYKVFIKERNRVLSGDIYIPELNLIIEFDGSYWHRNSLERDKEKTRLLRQQGINIIRVREFPLKKITRGDVISRVNTPLKKIVDAILKNILKLNICNKDNQKNITVYIQHKDLKNQRKAERYIRKKRAP